MKVVITGGAGFLGTRLAAALLQRGTLRGPDGRDEAIDQIALVDVVPPPAFSDPRVVSLSGDISDPELLAAAITRDTASVFHLAAIVSGKAEADFELGMRVNVDATRQLLDVARAQASCLRVVFASSIAVFADAGPGAVPENAAVRPQSSYGTQKAVAELLISDYTRRGFIDGRTLRLPTISVRPGRPNAAASSFASGIIREPLNGEDAVCPVAPGTRLWLASPSTAVACLIAGHELPGDALGTLTPGRTLNVPGISLTAAEMVASLERVAGPRVAGRVRWELDPRVAEIVATWPGALETTRARALGFPGDEGFDAVIRRYIQEEIGTNPGATEC